VRFRSALGALVLVIGAVGGGGWLLEQRAGIHAARAFAAEGPASGAPSGAWFCPHGGGEGWTATLTLTNPGEHAVTARVQSMSGGGTGAARDLPVPARSLVTVDVPANRRSASTEVQYFGGWIAAGWVAEAHGTTPSPGPGASPSPGAGGGESGGPGGTPAERGVAAEPCLAATGRTWLLPDGTTVQGQEDYLVVMNPFATEAVFGLTFVAEGRTVEAGDLEIAAGSSLAVHVNRSVLGDRTVGAVLVARIGRIAAASLGIGDDGGIRSAVGVPGPVGTVVLPGAGDSGRSEVALLNPDSAGVTYRVDLLAPDGRHAVQSPGQRLGPKAAATESLTATGPGAVVVGTTGGTGVAAARRTLGLRGDEGSTVATSPARAWLLTSPAADGSSSVQVALANPGDRPVDVTLTPIAAGGAPGSAPVRVTIPPGSAVAAPADFLAGNVRASVLATGSGTFVASMTSTSGSGIGYSVAAGVPVPPRWVPARGS
jgi:Family of unknown function (DUF5719)